MPADHPYPELQHAASAWPYQPDRTLLRGRTILVTGAGDGIGSCAARTFAWYGADLVLLGRTQAKLEQVFDWISANTTTDPVIASCDLEVADRAVFDFQIRTALDSAARARRRQQDIEGAAELYERILATFEDDDPARGVYELRLAEARALVS